jgi:hypothetical protein
MGSLDVLAQERCTAKKLLQPGTHRIGNVCDFSTPCPHQFDNWLFKGRIVVDMDDVNAALSKIKRVHQIPRALFVDIADQPLRKNSVLKEERGKRVLLPLPGGPATTVIRGLGN